jgi:uncharacterized membrane protein YdjX (TVP38/TMEM64 family)
VVVLILQTIINRKPAGRSARIGQVRAWGNPGERGDLRERSTASGSPDSSRWGAAASLLLVIVLAAGLPVLVGALGGGELLRELVEGAGPWAPVAYVAAKAVATIVAPLSGTPLKAASGALFGFVGGIGYSALGDIIGGCVCFWATRYAGRSAVVVFAGTDGMARVDELARNTGGWRAVLFGRLVLSPVYNLVSCAAGLTKLPFWQYLAVTALGGIVHTAFLVSLGASAVLDWKMRLAAYAAIAVLAAVALLGWRRLRRSLYRGF